MGQSTNNNSRIQRSKPSANRRAPSMESDSFSTRSSSPASRLPASFPVDAEGIVRNALHELLEGDLADQKRGTLTKTQETAYNRFFQFKQDYLGPAEFLEPNQLALGEKYRAAASTRGTPLNSLISLSNLCTFLRLVLVSAPNPTKKGTRSSNGISSQGLKQAARELMKTVVTNSEEINEPLIKLVIDLKRQACISADARTIKDAFSEPFRSHLPSSISVDPSLTRLFSKLQTESKTLIDQLDSDQKVLETRWKWEDTVAHCLKWTKDQASGQFRPLEEEVNSPMEDDDMGKDEGDSTQQTNDAAAGSDEDDEGGSAGGSETGGAEEESDDQMEQNSAEEEEEEESGSSQGSSKSDPSSRSPGSRSRVESQIQDEDDSDEDEEEDDDDLDLGGTNADYALDSPEKASSSSRREMRPIESASSTRLFETTVSQPDQHPTSASARPASPAAETRMTIRAGLITREVREKKSRSFLDRQPDAQKISFDSQSQVKSNSPRMSPGQLSNSELGSNRSKSAASPNVGETQHFPHDDFGGGGDEDEEEEEEEATQSQERSQPSLDISDDSRTDMLRRRALNTFSQPVASRSPSEASSSSAHRQPRQEGKSPKKRNRSRRSDSDSERASSTAEGEESQRGKSRKGKEKEKVRSKKARILPKKKARQLGRGDEDSDSEEESESDQSSEDEPHATKRRKLELKHRKEALETQRSVARREGEGNLYYLNRNKPGGRVPWSSDEERLLLKLLRDYGSDWKRMMKDHGPLGRVDRVFGYRNNVSLKDKAVVMKASYIRNRQPIPPGFDYVTVPASKRGSVRVVINNETDDEDDD
ncbi:uncharacterized protein JCM6883_003176 [Sporobolomyces salmoneus]|uniref:uncharacterized protein n=1 Tax=Sporobolomyces salmoneus TaxID=183962 RepID=UPI003179EA46